MPKNFLITSHTEGYAPFEQMTLLYGLVKSLKKYFPDCFIILASQSNVEYDTQKLVDYVIIDKVSSNKLHGQGEYQLVKAGLSILEKFNKKDCFKICYDFVIDDTNYKIFDQWLSYNKDFVSCKWNGESGIGTWVWYATLEFQKIIFDYEVLDIYFEGKVLKTITDKSLLDRCYIFDNQESMFNNDWFSRCDLVHQAGKVLKHNYGWVAAVINLTDKSEDTLIYWILFLLAQSRMPHHILIIDSRTDKIDLRTNEQYQKIFNILAKKNITWNLIYKLSQNELLQHFIDLGFEWIWLVDDISKIETDSLKNLVQYTILNYNVGILTDDSDNFFFRNKVILPDKENMLDMKNFLIDKMKETSYTINSLIKN